MRTVLLTAAAVIFLFSAISLSEQLGEITEERQEVIVFGGDSNNPPFSFIDKRGRPAGYNIEVMRAIAVVMGFDVRFQLGHLAEVSEAIENGLIDVTAASQGGELEKEMGFSTPLMIRYYIIVIREGDKVITSLEDLAGKEVIVKAGSYAQQHLTADSRGAKLFAAASETEALRLLASGQHDAAIAGNISCELIVRRYKLDNLVTSGPPVIARRYCLMTAKDNTELLNKLNEGLAILRQTGQHKVIYDKWIGSLERGILIGTILKYGAAILVPLLIVLGGAILWSVTLKRRVRQRTAQLRQEVAERQAAEANYHAIFDSANDAIFVHCADTGTIIDCNQKACEMLDYTRDQILKMTVGQLSSNEYHYNQNEAMKLVAKAAEDGPQLFEWVLRDSSGREFWVEVNLKSATIGSSHRVLAVVRDIRERKEAEQQLNLLTKAITDASNGIIITRHQEHDDLVIYVNAAFERITGYSAEDVIGKDCRFLQGSEKRQDGLKKLRKAISQGESCRVVLKNYRKNGTLFWNELTVSPVTNDKGQVTHYTGVITDISEIKNAEDALKQSEILYRAVVQDQTELIKRYNRDSTLIFVNNACCRFFAKKSEQLIGQKFFDFIPPDEVKSVKEHIESLSREKPEGQVEHHIRRFDGQWRMFRWTSRMIFDEAGNFVNYQAVGRDITELKESEEKYRQLVETMNEGLGVADENYVFTYVNQKFCEMLGYDRDEILGHKLLEFIHEESRETIEKQIAERKKGHTVMYEAAWKTKDGQKRYFLASPRAFFDEQGNFKGSLGALTDITKRKQAELERRKLLAALAINNKELESILYIASHDLRSPLVNIQGFSYELARSCDEVRSAISERGLSGKLTNEASVALNEGIPEELNYILTSTTKMDSLLLGLLQLSRLGRAAFNIERLDMNTLLEEVTETLKYKMKAAGAEIKLDPVPYCLGDYMQIEQVFTNLLDNAIKYLDESRKGMIHIYGWEEGERSVYCVEDNGIGIAPEHQGKIFELFYQLEPDKFEGEGLGLTIVRGIVERHEGRVWVQSQPGEGSRFFVALPRI